MIKLLIEEKSLDSNIFEFESLKELYEYVEIYYSKHVLEELKLNKVFDSTFDYLKIINE